MGDDAYERAATEVELDAMQAVVAEAMEAGAIGFATSASPTHNGDGGRPVPSRVADLDELRHPAASRCVAPTEAWWRCCPVACSRNDEVFDLQAEIGRPVHLDGAAHHRRVSRTTRRSWPSTTPPGPSGIDVWPQVSCRPLVFQMNLDEPFTLNMRQSFQDLMGVWPRRTGRRLPRSGLASVESGRSCRARAGLLPVQLEGAVGGRVEPAIPTWSGASVRRHRRRARRARRSTSCSTCLARRRPRPAFCRCWPTTTPRASPGCCPATAC